MIAYKAPLQDMRFALYDVIGGEALFKKLAIGTAQRDIMDAVLEEGARFTETVLSPLNPVGDQIGCVHDNSTGAVTTPPGFRDAFLKFVDGGWSGLTAPESMGGQDMPETLGAIMSATRTATRRRFSMSASLNMMGIAHSSPSLRTVTV